MNQITDRNAERATGCLGASTAAVLVRVAEHFRTVDHDARLDGLNLLACVSAEAFFVADGAEDEGAELARLALEALPELFVGITRGEARIHLRRVVVEAGHDWPDGDNDPAIPTITGIPGPRREPVPAETSSVVEQFAAPTCCGRAMSRDGGQWVCGKCGGWLDTGRAVLALLLSSDEGETV